MDLSTTYMGFRLKNPLVSAAGPLAADIGSIRRTEDAGAAAVVLHSLFEEQITAEAEELDQYLTQGTESFAESLTYFPAPGEFQRGPEEYLEHVAKAKRAIDIPLIASLNGVSTGGWTDYATLALLVVLGQVAVAVIAFLHGFGKLWLQANTSEIGIEHL